MSETNPGAEAGTGKKLVERFNADPADCGLYMNIMETTFDSGTRTGDSGLRDLSGEVFTSAHMAARTNRPHDNGCIVGGIILESN